MPRLFLNLYGRVLVSLTEVKNAELSSWTIYEERRLEAKQTPDFDLILNYLRAGKLPWILGISQEAT